MNVILRARLFVAALFVAGVAQAATFNLFQPANGILKGNPSTYVTTAAASTDVIALWTGTCDSTTFLRGDGSCQAVAAGPSPANPTASVGLSAVNGVATTYMRSDAAPSLSQSISPTWTANHTWGSSNPILSLNETDAAVDERLWELGVDSNVFTLSWCDDGSVSCTPFVTATRFSYGIDPLTFDAQSMNLNVNGSSIAMTADVDIQTNSSFNLTAGNLSTGTITIESLNSTVDIDGANGVVLNGIDSASFANLDLQNTFLLSSASAAGQAFINTSTGTTASNQLDVANSSNSLQLGLTSTGFSGAKLSGGPTGQAAFINTNAAVPLAFGTNGTARLAFDASGAWTVGGGVGTSGQVLTSSGAGSSPTWTTVGGGGSVTSVALTMPSGFSVGGSPVTTSGTLAVTTTLNGNLRGNGSGFTTGAVALGSEVSGTLPVANGGTGTTTSTGTGSVVLSASPTLTGTLTAATVAATAVTVGGQNVCQQNGTNCPAAAATIIARARVDITGACVLTNNSGFTSCTTGSTGQGTVNMTAAGFSATPVCTISAEPTGGITDSIATVSISSATSLAFTFSQAATLANGRMQLICVGT